MASKDTTKAAYDDDERMMKSSEKRQLGGMLMLTGLPALVFPLAGIVSAVGFDTDFDEGAIIPWTQFFGGLFVAMMGLMSVPAGYLQCVHDWGSKYLTGFLILWTQLAWVPFITDMTAVGKGAVSGDANFIPPLLEPTSTDVMYVGAMGIMGIACYGTGFLGSLAFIQFSLYAFQAGKPDSRPSSYYQSRLRFYSFVNFVGGFSQLFLGVYLYMQFGNGPLDAPVSVAMYFVYWPEISMAVGSLQVFNSFYAMIRSSGFGRQQRQNNHGLQVMMLLQWYAIVIFQIMVQIGYAPGGIAAPKAPSQVMLTMGINFIIAYLDYKMRTTTTTTQENMPSHGGRKVGNVGEQEQQQQESKAVGSPPVGASEYKATTLYDEAEDVESESEEDLYHLTPSAEASA